MRISDWSSDVCSSDLNARDPDFLFNDLRARLAHEPQRWHLVVTLAAPGDRTDNATVRWPETRERIDVGTLVIERAVPESSGPCRDVTFDPLVLPPGIAASDDRSEEHTSELQSLMRISYAVFCLKKKTTHNK